MMDLKSQPYCWNIQISQPVLLIWTIRARQLYLVPFSTWISSTVAKWKFFKMGHFKKHLSIGLNLPSLIKYKLDVSLWAALFLDFSVEVSFRESKGWPFRERAQMMFLWVKCSSFRVLGMLRGPLNLVHTFHAAQLPGKKWRSSSAVVLLTWCAPI